MLTRFSETIAEKMYSHAIIPQEEQTVISFGIKIGLTRIIHTAMSVLTGVCFGRGWEIFLFCIFFSALRGVAGGYHAKTNTSCMFCSCLITLLCAFSWNIIPTSAYGKVAIAFLLVSVPAILVLAPIADKNKPLDKIEKRVYRKKSIVITLLEIAVILLLFLFNQCLLALVGSTAVIVLAVVMGLGRFYQYK